MEALSFCVAVFLLLGVFSGVDGQFTVTIVSNPAGTPASGSTFDYPILSNVTLTCMVSSDDGSPFTVTSYVWTTSCFTNDVHDTETCFPNGQTTQSVTGNNLLAEDAGTITCTVFISGTPYTSGTLVLRISGIVITGASDISTDLVSSNQITDYSYIPHDIALDPFLAILRCATGVGPSGSDRTVTLGGWYFNGIQLEAPTGEVCFGPVFEVRGANARNYPGVLNLYRCGTFTTTEEGVYSCVVMNSSMMEQTMRVGVYFSGRTAPMIDPPSSSTVTVIVGSPLTLSCTSQGSPPDTFTWRKDSGPIVQSTSITTVTHTNTSAVFHTDYSMNSVTTSDSGTYTCTVTNPIGSDSETITVIFTCTNLNAPTDGMITCALGVDGVPTDGDTCSFTCNTGYELSGSAMRTCGSDGSWNGTDAVCNRVPCLMLSNPMNGIINCPLGDDGVLSYEDTCTATCDTGYILTGDAMRTCQIDGMLNGTEAMCSRVPCPSLADPTNGMIACSLGDDGVPSYEDTCNYTCSTGYVITGDVMRTCGSDGMWSGSQPMCLVTCVMLTHPTNGMVTCTLGVDGVPTDGDTCSFTCNTGYELSGSAMRTCGSDGSWNGTDAVCSRVPCPMLSNPMNGIINCTLGDDGVLSYEDTCTATCDTGYMLTDDAMRTCQSDGMFNGTNAACRRVFCPPLTDPTNGQITCSVGDDGALSYEDTCTTVCNTGYEVQSGNAMRTCQSNGMWSGTDSQCSRVSCSSLTDPDNGMIACSLGDDGVPSYEDTCSFTCNTGYVLTGSDTRTCQSDRMWNGSQPMCLVFAVTIVSNPAGTPVSGSTNTFDYPILSNVTLTCMVDPSPPAGTTYQWNTTGCFTNNAHNTPTCFPTGQTTQNVTGNNLLAEDAGTIICTVTIGGVDYTSGPLILRISGIVITGASDISTDLVSSNQITDYSYIPHDITLDPFLAILRCATGVGPSGSDHTVTLGGWYFNGIQLEAPIGEVCFGPVFEVRGANARNYPGVLNLYRCGIFTTTEEGVYSCIVMNSSMMEQTMRVGVYFSGRTAPMIDPPSLSTVTVVVGSPLTLSCTSRGSPPDTFTWRKDSGPIVQSTSITTVTHTNTSAVFLANYSINSITTSDSGTYKCTVTNPIGSDSETITVNVVTPFNISLPARIQGAMVGSFQAVECTVNADSGLDFGSIIISWMGPGGATITGNSRITISTTSSGNTYTSSIQFTYLMEGDEGTYTCNVMSSIGVSGSKSVEIDTVTVPLPTVTVTAPSNPTVGQSLTQTCSVTAVRGITSRVDILWRSYGTVMRRVNDTSPTMMDNSVVYTDSYTIPRLCMCSADQNEMYQCEVVINTSPLVMATDNVTLNLMANSTSTSAPNSEATDDDNSEIAAILGALLAVLAIALVISITINVLQFIQRKKSRLELQDYNHVVHENKNTPATVRFSEFNESKEPTYDVIGGTQMVNLTPNPAYGTTLQGKQNVIMAPNPAYGTTGKQNENMTPNPAYGTTGKQNENMTPNPAYGTTSLTVKNAEDPAYI